MPDHVVTTNHETLQSTCSCGQKASTLDIRRHIEAEQRERDAPVTPQPVAAPAEEPVSADLAVGVAEEPEEKPRRGRRRA